MRVKLESDYIRVTCRYHIMQIPCKAEKKSISS